MKNLKVWLVILPLLTTACSDEYITETIPATRVDSVMKKSGLGPGNSENPYDIAGNAHNALLETFDESSLSSPSIENIASLIDSISTVQPELASLPFGSSLSSRLTELTWLVNDDDPIDNVLTFSPLGTSAQTSFSTFLAALLMAEDDSYEDIYSMIVAYEATVIASISFTNDEKQIILTTTSIARYSFYRKKRKDKDWETNVGNIAATVSGAEEGIVTSLKMAVAVGMCHKMNITQ